MASKVGGGIPRDVRQTDMPKYMENDAIALAQEAFQAAFGKEKVVEQKEKKKDKKKKKVPQSKYKIEIKQTDMEVWLQERAIEAAKKAMDENPTVEKDIASSIKQTMESDYELQTKFPAQTWHCIVGQQYAVSLAYASKFLIFFSVNEHNILLFQSES